jgi:hypothetical protein
MVLTAEIFNQTVEEHNEDIKGFFRRAVGPLAGVFEFVGRGWASLTGGGNPLGVIVALLFLLGGVGLIYGITEPGFGFNEQTLVVVAALMATMLILTYWYDGSQILLGRRWGITSMIRLFPVGIAIAVGCVALTLADEFQPGIIYGFIASAVVIGAVEPDRAQQGKIIFFPALALLALAVAAWLLVGPFRDLGEDSDSWLAVLPEAIAVGVFVAALETLFIQMIPISFMDGNKVWKWNKWAWLAIAGTTAFLFWHILVNQESDSMSVLSEGMPAIIIALMLTCFVLTAATWLFFRINDARKASAG